MDEYTLYLDESYTYEHNGKNPAFAIGGFIIKNSDSNDINNRIDNLKKTIWADLSNPTSIILHEMDLKNALNTRITLSKIKPEYIRFRSNSILANRVYTEISKIVKNSNIYTIGCVVKNNDYYSNFPKGIGNEISLVCMQIILENYTHFLFKNNAIGKIIYESRDAMDKTMLMRFYQVSSIGTMYVRPDAIQQKIIQFCFIHKTENLQCLQLADFVPNSFAREHTGISQSKYNIFATLKYFRYDGNIGDKDRFGVKYML